MKDNRELNAIEQAIEKINRCSSTFQVVTVSCITGPMTGEILRQALDCVQSRHPRVQ